MASERYAHSDRVALRRTFYRSFYRPHWTQPYRRVRERAGDPLSYTIGPTPALLQNRGLQVQVLSPLLAFRPTQPPRLPELLPE